MFKKKNPTIRCYKCNTELPENAKFCSYCGTKVSGTVKCPKCDNKCKIGSNYCINCGEKL